MCFFSDCDCDSFHGLHRTQWKCSHYATATTSPTPMQPIVSKNKSQSQIAQCERALNKVVGFFSKEYLHKSFVKVLFSPHGSFQNEVCFIDGNCVRTGDLNPGDESQACLWTVDRFGWTTFFSQYFFFHH